MKEKRVCPVCKNEYSGRSDKKYCSLECKNKESNKTVMQLYYAGKSIQVVTQNKVLSAKEKLKSVIEKPSNLLKEPPKKKVVTGIGTLKIKVVKNPSQVQKKYLGQFLEEKQISIKELKNTFSSIEDNELFDKSNLKSLSSVANIIKELKAGKVLSFFLTGGRETNIFKYLGNDIFHLTEYSIEI